MVVYGGEIDSREQGDVAQRHPVKTARGINAFGRTEDALAGRLGRLLGHTDV